MLVSAIWQLAARFVKGKKIAPNLTAIVVPGSRPVKRAAEKLGLDKVFLDAGFEWRDPGCSMCLGMNPDKVLMVSTAPQPATATLKTDKDLALRLISVVQPWQLRQLSQGAS